MSTDKNYPYGEKGRGGGVWCGGVGWGGVVLLGRCKSVAGAASALQGGVLLQGVGTFEGQSINGLLLFPRGSVS